MRIMFFKKKDHFKLLTQVTGRYEGDVIQPCDIFAVLSI